MTPQTPTPPSRYPCKLCPYSNDQGEKLQGHYMAEHGYSFGESVRAVALTPPSEAGSTMEYRQVMGLVTADRYIQAVLISRITAAGVVEVLDIEGDWHKVNVSVLVTNHGPKQEHTNGT